MSPLGKFYGIGLGPGDPDLITRKALRILTEVDWIYLPVGASGEPGQAAAILAALGMDRSRWRPVTMNMARERDADLQTYAQTADAILQTLISGQSAAWVSEGDPFFYSTFAHVWRVLRRGNPDLTIEIVPGISSIQAAASRLQIPMAILDERVAVIPAAYGLANLSRLIEEFATIFLLKVSSVFDQLLDALDALPGPIEAIYVESLGTAQERIVWNVTTMRGSKPPYFSLVMLHHT
jgi:precorrin-2/cobalt-factor-2 C20-methyltransferase